MMTQNIDFLLFKASAGSGKTFNLAIQYISLLLTHNEQEFRHTLAVTFTNKATAEMKDRILDYLYYIWKGKDEGSGPLEAIKKTLCKQYGVNISDGEIRERCQRALHAILHDYSRFYVSTIDAFFQSVLRSMAHELSLNARLKVDLNDKDVIELAVENLVNDLRHDNHDVLPWLQKYIEQQLAESKSWDVRRELKKMAGMLFKEEYLKRSIDERNLPFNIENISRFRTTLLDEREKILKPISKEATAFENKLLQLGVDYEEICNHTKEVKKYITNMKAGNIGANFGKRLQEMVLDSSKLLKAPLRKESSLKEHAQWLSQSLDRISQLQNEGVGRIDSIDLALANLSPMGLLGAIDKEITRFTNEHNRFMLAHTPIMLKRMIQDEDASFVFERIGTRFNNIMIDEFQDTSRLQWDNFKVLLLDNLASGGLSMVVGDIKQSIYRWRNGDWKILYNLDKNGHNGIPLTQNPLRDNHRSLGHIVNFNNTFFPLAATELDHIVSPDNHQLQDLYNDVEQGIKKKTDGGLVRISICHSDLKEVKETWQETMLDDLCQQVVALHQQGVTYEDMAILIRKKKHIQPTIKYFAEHLPDIKLVSNEAFLLSASVAVKMIVNALQMVDDIERNPVAVRYVAKHYLRDVCHQEECQENDFLFPPYNTILPKEFVEQLEKMRFLPLYELCETLYRLLHLKEIKNQDAYLFTFFDELSTYLRDNPPDISSFLIYWEDTMQDIAIPNGDVKGICIYTIHKSKGLAFHTVLMPFAEWDVEKDYNSDLYWCAPNETPFNQMGTLPVKFTSRKIQGTVFEADYIEEHANRRTDELNALYVAFTRPKANLLVWGMSQHSIEMGKTDENVADLMYACLPEVEGLSMEQRDYITTYTCGQVESSSETKDEDIPPLVASMASYPGTFTFRQSTQATEFTQRKGEEYDETDNLQLTYIEQGKLLHYIFSKIETAGDIGRVTDQFALQGILKSEEQVMHVRKLAQQGLQSERVREWFSGNYRLFNECNILVPDPTEEGKLTVRRPDRVMMSQNRIIVVDFKFGKPKPDYETQVKEYVRILKEMYPQHIIEGWLWYVYRNQTEKVQL